MMRSMLSGTSGLRVHSIKMDVIANNVANVNTNDFQSSRTTFKDSFSHTIQQARANNVGTNPAQVGSGVSLASIDRITAPGAKKVVNGEVETMSNTDLAVEMTGMIVAQRGFEANARTVTMADIMLEELIRLREQSN